MHETHSIGRTQRRYTPSKFIRTNRFFQTYVNFLYEFLKSSSGGTQRGRKFSLVQSSTERTLHQPTCYTLSNNPQKTFEEALHQYIKSQENLKMRFSPKYLERSAMGCILEVS